MYGLMLGVTLPSATPSTCHTLCMQEWQTFRIDGEKVREWRQTGGGEWRRFAAIDA